MLLYIFSSDMGFGKDIRADKNFPRTVRIIVLFIFTFFLIDMIIGTILTEGLDRYYGLGSNAPLALVGHSQTMLGIDKVILEKELGLKVAKYTREGVNVADRQMMIKQLLSDNKELTYVIYGVDSWLFTGEGLSKNSYALFYPFMDDPVIRAYIKKHASLSEFLTHRLVKTTRFNEQLISGSFRGYLENWSNLKYGHVNIQRLKESIKNNTFRKINTNSANINIFINTLDELKESGVKVILVYIPTIDLLNEAAGPEFDRSIQFFQSMEIKFDNVIFLNYLEPYAHNHNLFYDPIHLNPEGQLEITYQLIKDLKKHFNADY